MYAGVKSAGAVIGISIGCLLGMVPLLFLSHSEGNHKHEPTLPGSATPAAAPVAAAACS